VELLLFVYGTLMRGFGLHRLLDGRARLVGRGAIGGRLFDLGAYPAAVPDPDGRIRGEVYALADPALWRVLDSAEGPQYHRGEVSVLMDDGGQRTASVYWFRGPLRGVPISGGDYRAHLPARSIHHDPTA
jgi:gamma-glutamylcyclotransferase (GGCT)/AIG2-like uncharacterized protein YtfP